MASNEDGGRASGPIAHSRFTLLQMLSGRALLGMAGAPRPPWRKVFTPDPSVTSRIVEAEKSGIAVVSDPSEFFFSECLRVDDMAIWHSSIDTRGDLPKKNDDATSTV